eukprot:TRINITY_DN12284_c0_g1_i3.p3 TRINITY_DN12284_c0_g1~~TRINITY_DN12284_c0_g1_i3.p3  ORF type:complete len:204 (-),score=-20.08 TRINITY_DN12284_c0_g1_i3:1698-2309(-)
MLRLQFVLEMLGLIYIMYHIQKLCQLKQVIRSSVLAQLQLCGSYDCDRKTQITKILRSNNVNIAYMQLFVTQNCVEKKRVDKEISNFLLRRIVQRIKKQIKNCDSIYWWVTFKLRARYIKFNKYDRIHQNYSIIKHILPVKFLEFLKTHVNKIYTQAKIITGKIYVAFGAKTLHYNKLLKFNFQITTSNLHSHKLKDNSQKIS